MKTIAATILSVSFLGAFVVLPAFVVLSATARGASTMELLTLAEASRWVQIGLYVGVGFAAPFILLHALWNFCMAAFGTVGWIEG